MLSGTLSGGAGGGGGRELDFREKKKKMQKEGEFLLDGCPIPGNNPNHPRTRWIARLFAFLLYLITLAIVGAMTVLVIMAKPIMQHNGYQATTCRVEETRLWGEQECRCGIGCRSRLPCGQVIVKYALVNNSTENVWMEGRLLHEDQLNEKHYPICSISSNAACYQQKTYNLKDVEEFLEYYNATKNEDSTFQCFYNRHNFDSVLLNIVPSTKFIQIILAASWGLVAIVVVLLFGLGLVLIGCNRCMDIPPPVVEEIPMTRAATNTDEDDSGWEKSAGGSQSRDADSIPEAIKIEPSPKCPKHIE